MILITKGTRSDSYNAVTPSRTTRQNQIVDEMIKGENIGYTARELAKSLYQQGIVDSDDRNQTHPRLNELVKLGRVFVSGKKLDEKTNRKVAIYKVAV